VLRCEEDNADRYFLHQNRYNCDYQDFEILHSGMYFVLWKRGTRKIGDKEQTGYRILIGANMKTLKLPFFDDSCMYYKFSIRMNDYNNWVKNSHIRK
jgi:hypothetical protein